MNNLAELLSATNRLAEAEPLYRQVLRNLAVFGYRTGHEHPHFYAAINNYTGLLSRPDQISRKKFGQIIPKVTISFSPAPPKIVS